MQQRFGTDDAELSVDIGANGGPVVEKTFPEDELHVDTLRQGPFS